MKQRGSSDIYRYLFAGYSISLYWWLYNIAINYCNIERMFSCIQCLQDGMNVIICFTAGYNYYGTERMFSGVNGQELEADIFIGVVYYQRLRHMVSDKFQVHSKLNSTGFCQSLSLFLSLSLKLCTVLLKNKNETVHS